MRVLLNEHLSPALAIWLRDSEIDCLCLQEWLDGDYLGEADEVILPASLADGRVFVSYDQGTLSPLLRSLAASGEHHAGVILIDDRTIAQGDIGGQLRALVAFVAEHGDEDWTDQVRYLPRPR